MSDIIKGSGELKFGDRMIPVKDIMLKLNYTIPDNLKILNHSLDKLSKGFKASITAFGNINFPMQRIAASFQKQEKLLLEIKRDFAEFYTPDVAMFLFKAVRRKIYAINIVKLLYSNGASADDIFWFLVRIKPWKMHLPAGSLESGMNCVINMSKNMRSNIKFNWRRWINNL